MEQLAQQLKSLGLGDYEALIYATLVSASPASATFLAKKCGLSRSSVYTTLAALTAKGLVGTTYKNDVKQFVAQDHAALEQLLKKEKASLEARFKTLEAVRSSFESLGKNSINVPQTIFFEGQEGLKKIYLSMMRQAKPKSVLYLLRDEFVWRPEWGFINEPEWHDRVRRIKAEKDIRTRLLINSTKSEKANVKFYDSKKGLEYRFLPADHPVKRFAIYIIDDIVSVMSREENNLVGIKIANRHFAENFKNLFEVWWGKS